jgi:hypothetical protein
MAINMEVLTGEVFHRVGDNCKSPQFLIPEKVHGPRCDGYLCRRSKHMADFERHPRVFWSYLLVPMLHVFRQNKILEYS